ncbi:MAG: DUF4342 domain-containing protein [Clostridiaceae bacterium]|nr:DUF4342 domain-containing protein [Clostridiaceae bacterium]
MAISMELIDEMRKRTNCSYAEAKALLEKHNGDLLEAIVDFERKNSTGQGNRTGSRNGSGDVSLGSRISRLIAKGFKTRFIVERSGETIINVSINLMILAAMILNWFLLVILVISFMMGCRFRIRKEKGDTIDLNKMVDSFGSKVRETAARMEDKYKASNNENSTGKNGNSDEDDGYNEVTIE